MDFQHSLHGDVHVNSQYHVENTSEVKMQRIQDMNASCSFLVQGSMHRAGLHTALKYLVEVYNGVYIFHSFAATTLSKRALSCSRLRLQQQ